MSNARAITLPVLLVALVVGAFLSVKDSRTSGPTSSQMTQAIAQAQASVTTVNFRGAELALQAWYAQNGSYTGATLPSGSGVSLVRADATSFCLQATAADGSTAHESGPGGGALPGPC
jgi:hypothetical protein